LSTDFRQGFWNVSDDIANAAHFAAGYDVVLGGKHANMFRRGHNISLVNSDSKKNSYLSYSTIAIG
jgi:hypothetical protein